MTILGALSDKTEYTWKQRLMFFCIGAIKACGWGALPALVAAWHNYRNYTDATDWGLVWELALTGIGLKLKSYWNEHKALLQIPPGFVIPAEFEPKTPGNMESGESKT